MKKGLLVFALILFSSSGLKAECGMKLIDSGSGGGSAGGALILVSFSSSTSFGNTSSEVSGTSGCGKGKKAANETKSLKFIAFNLERLNEEASRGKGEFLESYATLLGCGEKAVLPFSESLKKSYAEIFGEQKLADEVLIKTRAMIAQDSGLSSQCAAR
ncbi:MAG: DUF3015 domain-containing protein [Deltaproteobacteria bacterium]|nr:DUF3015 domain-containing protein [Deltaproteobacteria bacterium]